MSKLWYEIGDPPKGYKIASMTEAKNANKIYRYGQFKVDNILIDSIIKDRKQIKEKSKKHIKKTKG